LFVIIYGIISSMASSRGRELKAKLGDEDAFLSVMEEEPAASDIEAPAAGTGMAAQGSSGSDSSGPC
jgi:hypothetical protein